MATARSTTLTEQFITSHSSRTMATTASNSELWSQGLRSQSYNLILYPKKGETWCEHEKNSDAASSPYSLHGDSLNIRKNDKYDASRKERKDKIHVAVENSIHHTRHKPLPKIWTKTVNENFTLPKSLHAQFFAAPDQPQHKKNNKSKTWWPAICKVNLMPICIHARTTTPTNAKWVSTSSIHHICVSWRIHYYLPQRLWIIEGECKTVLRHADFSNHQFLTKINSIPSSEISQVQHGYECVVVCKCKRKCGCECEYDCAFCWCQWW